ncbi:hypothetical protein VD0002_g8547 [Verticillium dahliae]|nr:hypothetical protein VD0002_g8547 [Verticillium dahliae]
MSARLRWLTARPFLTDFSKRLLGYATWIPVVIMFNNYVAEIHNVHGPSMYPFFNEDYNSSLLQDKVLTWKWWPQYDLERGMIVTFRSPNNPEAISIKRIIAVEGDVVRTKAPYPEPVARVPQGHIWVEGDGDKTIDSNTYGPVPMSLVTGKSSRAKPHPQQRSISVPAPSFASRNFSPLPSSPGRPLGDITTGFSAAAFFLWLRHVPLTTSTSIPSSSSCFPNRPLSSHLAPFDGGGRPAVDPRRRIFRATSMSLADRITGLFSPTTPSSPAPLDDRHAAGADLLTNLGYRGTPTTPDAAHHQSPLSAQARAQAQAQAQAMSNAASDHADLGEEARPPYLHAMIAGGIGGSTGDMLMHSLDTVKTRQQGDPHVPPKYNSLTTSYYTIWRQEGVRRGLYGGWKPALGGSFPGTMLFFGTYEWSKRVLIDGGVPHHLAYFSAGFLGDLASSIVYVPSEVLKTRLQLQGRYDNPYFRSGYNYRGTTDAVRTIVRQEGPKALFHGYKATLYRDLPFSALQLMFWEQFHAWARAYKGSREVGVPLELLTGGLAGGLAGIVTCPLDVVKTRLQTQVHIPPEAAAASSAATNKTAHASHPQKRNISTSSPSTHTPRLGAVNLKTMSVLKGLGVIYQTEGLGGWFRGVGPRGVWTFIQSGCMLFLYQRLLRELSIWDPRDEEKVAPM